MNNEVYWSSGTKKLYTMITLLGTIFLTMPMFYRIYHGFPTTTDSKYLAGFAVINSLLAVFYLIPSFIREEIAETGKVSGFSYFIFIFSFPFLMSVAAVFVAFDFINIGDDDNTNFFGNDVYDSNTKKEDKPQDNIKKFTLINGGKV